MDRKPTKHVPPSSQDLCSRCDCQASKVKAMFFLKKMIHKAACTHDCEPRREETGCRSSSRRGEEVQTQAEPLMGDLLLQLDY